MLQIKTILIIFFIFMSSIAFAEETPTYNPLTSTLHLPKAKIIGDTSGTVYSVDMRYGNGLFTITGMNGYSEGQPNPTNLFITGSSTVVENNHLKLDAIVVWDNGTWTNVSEEAVWSESSAAINSVSKGDVYAGPVSYNTSAIVSANIAIQNVNLHAAKTITIANGFTSLLYVNVLNQTTFVQSGQPLGVNFVEAITFMLDGHQYTLNCNYYEITSYQQLVNIINSEIYRLGLNDTRAYLSNMTFVPMPPDGSFGYTIVIETINHEFTNPRIIINDNHFGNVHWDLSIDKI